MAITPYKKTQNAGQLTGIFHSEQTEDSHLFRHKKRAADQIEKAEGKQGARCEYLAKYACIIDRFLLTLFGYIGNKLL